METIIEDIFNVLEGFRTDDTNWEEYRYYDIFLAEQLAYLKKKESETLPKVIIGSFNDNNTDDMDYVVNEDGFIMEFDGIQTAKEYVSNNFSPDEARYMVFHRSLGKCFRCGSNLYPSIIAGYTSQCFHCDEDFFSMEQDTHSVSSDVLTAAAPQTIYLCPEVDGKWSATMDTEPPTPAYIRLTEEGQYPVNVYFWRFDLMGSSMLVSRTYADRESLLTCLNELGKSYLPIRSLWSFQSEHCSEGIRTLFDRADTRRYKLAQENTENFT